MPENNSNKASSSTIIFVYYLQGGKALVCAKEGREKQKGRYFFCSFLYCRNQKTEKTHKEARRRKRLRAKAGRSLLSYWKFNASISQKEEKNNKNSEVSPEIWGKTVFIEIFWKKGRKALRNLRFCTIIYSVKLYGYGKGRIGGGKKAHPFGD